MFALLVFFVLLLTEATSLRGNYGGGGAPAEPTGSYGSGTPKSKPHGHKDTCSRNSLKLLDAEDTVILLLDHQSGLFQTVKDVPIREMRINVKVLSELANLASLPIISTASEPKGPNGPIMPEIAATAAVTYVPRQGEISAWENPNFVAAVKATGRKTLVMAGVWTSVCVAFPAIQAMADGYTVYAVIDASGDESEMASHVTQTRMAQAGVILVTTNVVVAEVQRTWRRPDAAQYAELYAEFNPHYNAAIEQYNAAQAAKECPP